MSNEKQTNLSVMIEREETILKKYKAKRAEYDEKIKKSEAKLHEYRMMENSQMFNTISEAARNKGLSVDDIITALQTGDLISLQEQLEAAQSKLRAEREMEAEYEMEGDNEFSFEDENPDYEA